ncbi:hypothetical protein M405DRAFT_838552 [Rhizopogon salebrosus TDB-379]|nr:hypothetical protein M405DRAFT_838552 [Rhizopogon salebrosus TDB-379]
MWTQQPTISSVIISTTGFGILFYVGTILISVWHPDSPFQTAGSALMRAIFKKTLLPSTPDIFTKSSAIHWILETSTNLEIVEAAAAMIPRVQWPSKLDASAIYARLLDNFADSVDRPELFVTYGKVLTHLRIQSLKTSSIDWKEMITWHTVGERNRFIRDAFIDARLAHDRFKKTESKASRWKHMADILTG